MSTYGNAPRGGRLSPARLLIALLLAAASAIGYFSMKQYNPVTGETQHVSMSVGQEIAIGLQAAPEMAAQYGGLEPDPQAQEMVKAVGRKVLAGSAAGKSEYQFDFHLLADPETINAFALPGGQVFITNGLLRRLTTEGQLAGVLGHEIGHVVGRHGAEQMARAQLTQGLTGAAVIATYDPDDPNSRGSAQVALLVGQLVSMKFGRDDESEADRLGVRFLAEAGYDPRALLGVMQVLAEAAQGPRPPEFFSTHPNPENRMQAIETAIAEAFPGGVPEGMTP